MDTDVITMPAALGERVLTALKVAMLAGPVLCQGDRWAFLTGEGHRLPPRVVAELAALGVRLDDSAQPGGWTDTDRQTPPWTAVIATIRTVACRVPVAA